VRLRSGSVAAGGAGVVRRLGAALALAAGALAADAARAQLPDAIAALDAAPLLTVHAEGAQIYECRAAADGKLNWAFREPIASLMLDGRTMGRHYAGPTAAPTWEHADGSSVTAKVVGTAPGATAADIPWLKLDVTERRGSGTLAGADIVSKSTPSAAFCMARASAPAACAASPMRPTTCSGTKIAELVANCRRTRWHARAHTPILWL
jgi:Protein of unknown function (DUF3455)